MTLMDALIHRIDNWRFALSRYQEVDPQNQECPSVVSFCPSLFHWDPPITFHHESHCMPGPIISSDLSLEPVVTSELVGSGIHGASVNGPSLRDLFQWLWTPVGT